MAQKQTTLFDLNETATSAAITALGVDPYKTDNIKLEAFNAAGHDEVDYADWSGMFTNAVNNFTALKNRPAKSTMAAQAKAKADADAAAAAAAKAAQAAPAAAATNQ